MLRRAPPSLDTEQRKGSMIRLRGSNSPEESPAPKINQNAAIDSAKLQAISTIISRMGAKLAQDIEKGMEMRY